MTTKQVDILNLFLLLFSAGLSIFFPLEVFVLAYFILGPVHYITEINWLSTKQYFVSEKKYVWFAGGLSLIIALNIVFTRWQNGLIPYQREIFYITTLLMLVLFVFPIGWQYIKQKKFISLALLIVAIALLCVFRGMDSPLFIVGVFLPTLIHVYLFTIMFMYFGAKKSKSKIGLWLVPIALILPLVFILIPTDQFSYLFPESFKDFFKENNFHLVLASLGKYMGIMDGKTFFFYEKTELKLLMFLSFVYLYHYLNWFSKTTVIQWHEKIDKKKAVLIVLSWFIILTLVYLNIMLGLFVVLFLSFLHVFLEFPLNVKTIGFLLKRK